MALRLKSASFVEGALSIDTLKNHTELEFALLGRSNVGKSTFLNRLCNQKRLARVSSTPGRTQEINLFEILLKISDKKDKLVYLCDLPGYGFAKMPISKKKILAQALFDYLTNRENLQCVLFLLDCRRTPTEEERYLRDLAFEAGRQILPIITKADKLSKNQLFNAKKEISSKLNLEATDILVSGEGLDTLPIWQCMLEPYI